MTDIPDESLTGRAWLERLRVALLAIHRALVDESFAAYDACPDPTTWPSSANPARRIVLEDLQGRLGRLSRAIDGAEALLELERRGEVPE